MDQDTKNNKLSESIEFLADFQLLFGNIIRINGAFLEVAEKICSDDELITVPIWRVIAVIRINPMTVRNCHWVYSYNSNHTPYWYSDQLII